MLRDIIDNRTRKLAPKINAFRVVVMSPAKPWWRNSAHRP
jgi:hypothetical protein